MRYEFEQVDVFTNEALAGNPLAVFPEASGLDPARMQKIAREMNLSETTFVTEPTLPDCAARYLIYMPTKELPFAGHPTLGTAYVLARRGYLRDGSNVLNLQARTGKVAVRVEGQTDRPQALYFTCPPTTFGIVLENRKALAEAIGLTESDLLPDAPAQEAGCPVMHFNVGLRSPELVDRVTVRNERFEKLAAGATSDGIYFFAPAGSPDRIYARFIAFSPDGTFEDPATGSAAGPLGLYLQRHDLLTGSVDRLRIEQGTKMGRQSILTLLVGRRENGEASIEVGGSVVPVIRGVLEIP